MMPTLFEDATEYLPLNEHLGPGTAILRRPIGSSTAGERNGLIERRVEFFQVSGCKHDPSQRHRSISGIGFGDENAVYKK